MLIQSDLLTASKPKLSFRMCLIGSTFKEFPEDPVKTRLFIILKKTAAVERYWRAIAQIGGDRR